MDSEHFLSQLLEIFSSELDRYGFVLTYQKNPHIRHVRVGYISETANLKLLFVREWATSLYIGRANQSFDEEGDWFYFDHLVDYIQKQPVREAEKRDGQSYSEFLKENLVVMGQNFRCYFPQILSMFDNQIAIEKWEPAFRQYVKDEIQKKYNLPPRT